MGYQCRIERHSVIKGGSLGIVSFLISFPRRVLAETVTHRTNSDVWGDWDCYFTERTTTPELSKNSASSRAIPFVRMVKSIQEDPFTPFWTVNQAGMQGDLVTDESIKKKADAAWEAARVTAIICAEELHKLGVHKQDCNRLLEPFAWVTQLVTADTQSLNNFFALRCDQAADPHFRKIARMMFLALRKSTPVELEYGQWHLPFVPLEEQMKFRWEPFENSAAYFTHPELPDLIKYSAARCGWISYKNHDQDGSAEAMLRTFDRFVGSSPVHAAPVESQLTPMPEYFPERYRSNIKGWLQARKLLKNEKALTYEPSEEEIASWGEEV